MATAGALPQASVQDADLGARAAGLLALTEDRLARLLPSPPAGETPVLFGAARAALLGRGKRVRPMMSMLACAHVQGRAEDALDYGCAVEIVHAASLVLDDPPCMDDAAVRRGAPTVHRAHGEDAAVLAAVALLNEAHRTILRDVGLDAASRLALIDALTAAVGFSGLSHGQIRDLRDSDEDRTEHGLRRLNHLQTGALFVAALRGGGIVGGASLAQLRALSEFGEAIGFAFQLCDDLQDVTATAAELGKDVAKDRGKLTFVDLWGEGRVRVAVRQSVARAQEALGDDCDLSAYVRGLFIDAGFTR
jgi:geranylgeranyl diphosphate synthase type II